MRLLVSNWRIALSVGAAGMALPFGLGCAIAYGLYHQFRTESGLVPISFGTYMLFVGVAMAITVSVGLSQRACSDADSTGFPRTLPYLDRAPTLARSSRRRRALSRCR